jgi:hypothetical protein
MSRLRQQEGLGLRSSDIRRERRDRKRRICNVIHYSTWIVESGTLLFCIVSHILSINVDPYLLSCLGDTAYLVFWRIISPYSHLFNEHRIKAIILQDGWISAMKHSLQLNVVRRNLQPDTRANTCRNKHTTRNNVKVIERPVNKRANKRIHKVGQVSNNTKVYSIELRQDVYRKQVLPRITEHVPVHVESTILPNAVTA